MFGQKVMLVHIVHVGMGPLYVQKKFVQFYNVNLYVNLFNHLFFNIKKPSVDLFRMKKLFVYQIVAVQYVVIGIFVDFMVIMVIKSIMNMIYGIHQHASIVHVDGIIVSYVKVFNVNINFVLKEKFKNHDRILVVYHAEKLNNAI